MSLKRVQSPASKYCCARSPAFPSSSCTNSGFSRFTCWTAAATKTILQGCSETLSLCQCIMVNGIRVSCRRTAKACCRKRCCGHSRHRSVAQLASRCFGPPPLGCACPGMGLGRLSMCTCFRKRTDSATESNCFRSREPGGGPSWYRSLCRRRF